jgi:hypothetical protein
VVGERPSRGRRKSFLKPLPTRCLGFDACSSGQGGERGVAGVSAAKVTVRTDALEGPVLGVPPVVLSLSRRPLLASVSISFPGVTAASPPSAHRGVSSTLSIWEVCEGGGGGGGWESDRRRSESRTGLEGTTGSWGGDDRTMLCARRVRSGREVKE